eukprot:Nk52_evm1s370 gene=Nk52_evmTU1s370
MAMKRLAKEYANIQEQGGIEGYGEIKCDESNMLLWEAILIPTAEPYDKGAFKVGIEFPAEYPFKPPKVEFRTRIYHPNIDEKGNICMGILKAENWKPATKVVNVLESLMQLVQEPNAADPLVGEIAEIFTTDKTKFKKNVEEYIKKYALKRPKKKN